MISKRIPENSCDIYHFDKAALDYGIVLQNSEFNDNVSYI